MAKKKKSSGNSNSVSKVIATENNKVLRAERHKKRLERFTKRKADGKCYVYGKKDNSVYKVTASKKTEFSLFKSIMTKVNNELNKKALDDKERELKAAR